MTLSAYYVLVGRDWVVNALVCLRIWKRSFSLGNVQRKKICVSQVLGCYKQDEGMLICLRRDTLLSQDGALLSHLLERKKAVISHDRRARWLSAAQSLLCEGHIPIEEERSGLTYSASSTPLGFTPACLRTDIPATVMSKADTVTARTTSEWKQTFIKDVHSRLLLRVLPGWSTARLRTRNFSQLHRVADTGGLMATFWKLIGRHWLSECLSLNWMGPKELHTT